MKIDPSTIKKVLWSITITQDEEMTCGECFQEVDQYVDMLREGKSPAEVLPLVEHHLTLCPPCREEFEALVVALKAIDEELE
ncbi:MAG TPA: hypothetical protein DCY42_09245 [Chloroflexi bacterium]|nr:hypothetical protein [Chloroflexota bacterium]